MKKQEQDLKMILEGKNSKEVLPNVHLKYDLTIPFCPLRGNE